ncbi:MAG TPA: DoxX family protein [Candidatus Acidoferrum sp.]|nr:DoxX family protein [Candidatus Acidoferrum sp.]
MGGQVPIAQAQQEPQMPHWSVARGVAFRFCFVYFGLYCLGTQIVGGLFLIPIAEVADPASLWPMRQITFWTAAHIFHAKLPLIYKDSGSGDKTFDWVFAFCLLVIAALATGIWSALDRRRENYITLYKWFRLFIRFALASEMILYGIDKVIPLQMPFPYLTRLLEPYHEFSPMGVLWSSIGASPAYEIFVGCAETLGGILLIFPRTTTLGALVSLADLTQVFMLNMTYDVPVKLFSFHLLLMALFLLAPEFQRLADFFFRNRTAEPSTQDELFQTRRANRIALVAQIIFGIWLIGANVYTGWDAWHTYGGGRPKSPLYGIWNVSELSIDGQVRSPLLSDYDRWQRVVFDFPERVSFQRMDDSFAGYGATINTNEKTIALTKNIDKNWKANFTFERVAEDQLILDGDMDSHKIRMKLQLVDHKKSLLVSRGFHWIQEYPFNR